MKKFQNDCQSTLSLGTCYYPEQWDRDLWEEDLQRMLAAGIRKIYVGGFVWNQGDGQGGVFNHDLMDEFTSVIGGTEMNMLFGTPQELQSETDSWIGGNTPAAPKPGQLTLWVMQKIARGADHVNVFRWRSGARGAEIYDQSILDHDNRDNRKLAEVKQIYSRLEGLSELAGSEYAASFGVLQDDDNLRDMQIDGWHQRLTQRSEAEIFQAASHSHTPGTYVHLQENTQAEELTRYPVLFYPHPMVLTEKKVEVLSRYVENGGWLIVGARAGLKDRTGSCVMAPVPGLLQPLTGTQVREGTIIDYEDDPVYLDFDGERLNSGIYNEILEVVSPDTRVLEYYDGSYYAGEPALTEHEYGEGRVLHFGGTFTESLVESLLAYAGIRKPFGEQIWLPEDCELCVREKEGRRWLFVLNQSNQKQTIFLRTAMTEAETKKAAEGEIHLAAYETKVYEIKK